MDTVNPYYKDRKKLEEFRKQLLEEKKRILERYFKQEETIKRLTEEGLTLPEELDDYARNDYIELVLSELEDIEIEIIRQIDNALEKMKEGTYGLCEVCGKPIEEERLKVIPWTTYCKEHAEEAQKNVDFIDRRYKEYLLKSGLLKSEQYEEEVEQEGEDK